MSWCVKYQVVQAPCHVLTYLFDGFVGVRRHDPALGDLFDWQRIGGLLHLDRVVDAVLLLSCQRQRRPKPGVVQCQLRVGVVGDLDFDHLVDAVDGSVSGSGAFSYRRHQLLGVELLALAGRTDEAVTGAAGVLGHRRPPAAM